MIDAHMLRLTRAIAAAGLLLGMVLLSGVTTETQSQLGQWAPVMDWGYQAKHMVALPNGKVLVFRTGDTARVWDPLTNAFLMAPALFGDLHCAIQLTLPDGRVVVFGGQMNSTHIGTKVTSIFDWTTNTWSQGAQMTYARWYPTATPLGNGEILVTNGDDDHGQRVTTPEVYNPDTNTWRLLTTAQRTQSLYSFVYQLPNGKVYEAAPSTNTAYINVTGTGAWTNGPAGLWSTNSYSESGATYAPGKIIRVGGGDPASARTAVIDMNAATPQWRETSPMSFARRRMNLVILADGSIMAVGGTRSSDSESAAVLEGEIWNPDTEQWTTVAPMAEARMYHSTALLLEDGRVLSGGGEASGRNHAQIYSPPYLFKGARPAITSSPESASYGSTFFVGTATPTAITSVALLRSGAPTHAIDMNQRYVPLTFTTTSGGLNVTAPPNGNHTPPGIYMLLLKNGSGVPSVARWIRIGAAPPSPGSIKGHVTNATTGAGVAGATVHYPGGSTSTNADGAYQFAGVSTGQHLVTVDAAGYATATGTVTVSSGQAATLDFALVEPGSITGRVTDTLGNPIGGATLSFAGGTTTTDGNGEYLVANIASGSQLLTASATSFVTTSQTVLVAANAAVTADFALEVMPSYIAGEVVNVAANVPIPGASVSYFGGSTTTDALGRYRLENVAPGMVSVTVSVAGFVGATQDVLVPYGNYATSDFDLTPLVPPPPPPGATRIKDITFENGLTDALAGFDKAPSGTALVTTNALKGTRSGTATTGAFEENFTPADDFFVSFYLRVNAMTSGSPRIVLISNGGTTAGNLLLTSSRKLRLRNGSSTIGADSPALTVGQLYRVGVHQKKGSGKNGVLEVFLAPGDDAFASPFAATSTGTWKTAADRIRIGDTNAKVNLTIDDVRLDAGSMPGTASATSDPASEPVTADFTADVTSGPAPLTVMFNSAGSNGSITTWSWDVDNDGTPDSTTANPNVVYNAAGTYTVTLTVSDGTTSDTVTRTAYISVAPPVPTVTAFSPLSGPAGTPVTLTGSGLAGASSVTFNGVAGTSLIVDSATQVRVTVPAGATTGLLTLTAPGGSATTAAPFTVTTVSEPPPSPGTPLATALVADAQVNSNNQTKNEGTLTSLRTRLGDASNPITYNSYLKFEVTGLTGTVVAATLRIYATDANAAGVNVYASGSDWTESGITWKTAPALGALVGTSGAIAKNTWVEIALAPGTFTANQAYTVVVAGRNTSSEYFGSRESANKPQLVLSAAP